MKLKDLTPLSKINEEMFVHSSSFINPVVDALAQAKAFSFVKRLSSKIKSDGGSDRVPRFSVDVPNKEAGFFGNMMNGLQLSFEVHKVTPSESQIWIHLSWKWSDGGTNGQKVATMWIDHSTLKIKKTEYHFKNV